MKIAKLVYDNILPLFNGDIKLVDVEYVKKNDGMHLVIYIDKVTGVTIDDCERVSKMLDEPLDEINPTADAPYNLDVSSYGLDKPFKFDWQYRKYLNKDVDVVLYRKVGELKSFTAKLIDRNETNTQFDVGSEVVTISNQDIAKVTPHIDF